MHSFFLCYMREKEFPFVFYFPFLPPIPLRKLYFFYWIIRCVMNCSRNSRKQSFSPFIPGCSWFWCAYKCGLKHKKRNKLNFWFLLKVGSQGLFCKWRLRHLSLHSVTVFTHEVLQSWVSTHLSTLHSLYVL